MTTATNLYTSVECRWMIRRDLPGVMEIERTSHDSPRGEEEILAFLRRRDGIGMAAVRGDRVLGFALYSLTRQSVEIDTIAVRRDHRRQGIGRQIVRKFAGKLGELRRRLVIDVRECALSGQLFLRSQGFKAAEVLREHYEDTGEDGYRFVYEIEGEGPPSADVPADDGWLLD